MIQAPPKSQYVISPPEYETVASIIFAHDLQTHKENKIARDEAALARDKAELSKLKVRIKVLKQAIRRNKKSQQDAKHSQRLS